MSISQDWRDCTIYPQFLMSHQRSPKSDLDRLWRGTKGEKTRSHRYCVPPPPFPAILDGKRRGWWSASRKTFLGEQTKPLTTRLLLNLLIGQHNELCQQHNYFSQVRMSSSSCSLFEGRRCSSCVHWHTYAVHVYVYFLWFVCVCACVCSTVHVCVCVCVCRLCVRLLSWGGRCVCVCVCVCVWEREQVMMGSLVKFCMFTSCFMAFANPIEKLLLFVLIIGLLYTPPSLRVLACMSVRRLQTLLHSECWPVCQSGHNKPSFTQSAGLYVSQATTNPPSLRVLACMSVRPQQTLLHSECWPVCQSGHNKPSFTQSAGLYVSQATTNPPSLRVLACMSVRRLQTLLHSECWPVCQSGHNKPSFTQSAGLYVSQATTNHWMEDWLVLLVQRGNQIHLSDDSPWFISCHLV